MAFRPTSVVAQRSIVALSDHLNQQARHALQRGDYDI
jgi:hypothetical protein